MMPRKVHTVESLRARTIEVGDCWEWQGYSAHGTPQVFNRVDGSKRRMYSVRRLFRELITGQPQPDGFYSVSCGNAECVNPDHVLYRNDRNHFKSMGRKVANNPVRSMKLSQYHRNNGKAKLDEQKAQEIRLSNESGPVLAARYGVNRSLISSIRRGKIWKCLSNPFRGLIQ